MGNTDDADERRPGATNQSGESKLRGDAAEHGTLKKKRNPDTELHLDNEEDTLYNDGLKLEDDTPPMGTAGRRDDNALASRGRFADDGGEIPTRPCRW